MIAASMLSQLIFWVKVKKQNLVYKSWKNWSDELGISERQARYARQKLEEIGLISTKLNNTEYAKVLHYKVNFKLLHKMMNNGPESCVTRPDTVDTPYDTHDTLHIIKPYTKPYSSTIVEDDLLLDTKVSKNKSTKCRKQTEMIRSLNAFDDNKTDKHDDKMLYVLEKEVLDHWNESFAGIKDVPKHKKLTSKVQVSIKQYVPLLDIIGRVLGRGIHISEIKKSISEYKNQVETSVVQKYNLGMFLSGKYLNDKYGDLINNLRLQFQPVTSNYDKTKIYDKDRKTYFGFHIDDLQNWEPKYRDLFGVIQEYGDKYRFGKEKDYNYTYFRNLEIVLAGLFFFRKKLDQVDGKILYMSKFWFKYKDLYKKDSS